jgi:predicted alpha-1,2-mannosidase
MKQNILFTAIKMLFFLFIANTLPAQKDLTKLVNPFIGTGGHGHTYPGATSPFGMVQLSPDTRMADWDGSSGYHYSDSIIYGFSHTHLSGTGVPDYCDILFQPFTGAPQWDKENYASGFSHNNEKAFAGFYSVHLDKYNIDVSLTTGSRTGLHRYNYPKEEKESNVLLDLINRDQVLDSYIEIMDDGYTIKGFRYSKGWARNQKLYFMARFSKKIQRKAIHVSGAETQNLSAGSAKGKAIQAAFSFDNQDGKPLDMEISLSAVSMDQAALNLSGKTGIADFDETLQKNTESWNKELGKMEITSFPENNIDTIFYTALYHTMVVPNLYQDVNGYYRGTDDSIHTAKDFTNYSVFSLWDTYRAYHPLMSMINRERTLNWIKSFLHQYQNGGMLPVWELSANETFCMIGYHSIPVIVDAFNKGIRDFDTDLALEAMLNYSQSTRFAIDVYAKKGFLSNDEEAESVSKTMEYAYDDWCIATFAKALGKNEIAAEYFKRSCNYRNLFNPVTGFFQGKLHGKWMIPFDANEINNFYTEGNAWQYSLAAPQDINGLKELYGGLAGFTKHLQNLFTTSNITTGREQPDVSGLIGQYAQGNEPSHHMAYLFQYSAKPELTAYYVDKICREFYKNTPDGLIGNEDCGQMSAWYIWSVLGMYPVNPAANEFVLGMPQIKKAVLHLETGKDFTILVDPNYKADYFKAMKTAGKNGIPQTISYNLIRDAGTLEFNFSKFPGTGLNNAPLPVVKPLSDEFVAVPFVAGGFDKFRKQTTVTLNQIEKDATIHYYFITKNPFEIAVKNTIKDSTKNQIEENGNIQKNAKAAIGIPGTNKLNTSFYKVYTRPFVIKESGTLYFYAEKNGKFSGNVEQPFYKIRDDKNIKVLSKVNPMYTAGGEEALIDGIIGSTNWRAGEWQSYYGNDFEAIIDLKKERAVQQVQAWFLQDIRSWIWMPVEMQIETSIDGKNFSLIKTVPNSINEKDENTNVYSIQAGFEHLKTRYIKIRAKNFGTIPNWHLGAGNQAHLFISEIAIN